MKLKPLLASLRPKDWMKNLLLFVPLLFGRKLFESPENLRTLIAFVLFCGAASSVYLINDLLDLEKDRLHRTKRLRPLPAGKLGKGEAWTAALLLGLVSTGLSFLFQISFGTIVAIYFSFNFLYTKVLRDIPLVDIFCLVFFLLIRILAGGVVAQVTLSHWLVLVTGLLALFLALIKRRDEVRVLKGEAGSHRRGLGAYSPELMELLVTVATASLLTAYTLYTVDERTIQEFGSSHLLISVPFVYYGIFRYLHLVYRHHQGGHPAEVFLNDRPLQINLVLWFFSCAGVVYFGW